jgi:hypothetical protein
MVPDEMYEDAVKATKASQSNVVLHMAACATWLSSQDRLRVHNQFVDVHVRVS